MKSSVFQTSVSVILSAMLSGCGAIPFKESTNTEDDQDYTQSQQAGYNQQVSFQLRDKRYKQVEGETVDCTPPNKHKDVLVMLALSGGGSRAALLSGLSMIEMQNVDGVDLLSEVDLISSVSGGSLAAGYYAISGDPNPGDQNADHQKGRPECRQAVSGRIWSKEKVTKLMSKDYILPWFGNWFWPDNIALFWFSTYDRTDIMAQTFADKLFDSKWVGRDLRMSDLNPSRPNLIINATQGSASVSEAGTRSNSFGQPFTFTAEDFEKICSRIDDYEVARAVMASATFPGLFNFMTLKNHCAENKYVHLFDGGNSDNLGLTSLKRELWNLWEAGEGPKGNKIAKYGNIIVILVDAYTDSSGVSEKANDPRKWYDYIVDTNFITATDSLLAKNRDNLVNEFETKDIFPYSEGRLPLQGARGGDGTEEKQHMRQERNKLAMDCKKLFSWKPPKDAVETCRDTNWEKLNEEIRKKMTFVHVNFGDITDASLKRQLNDIATDFRLRNVPDLDGTGLTAKEAIECAVPLLFGRDNVCGRGEYRGEYTASDEAKIKREAVLDVYKPASGR